MYFNVNFNVFFKLIKVHFLVTEPYIHIYIYIYIYQNARCKDKNNGLNVFRSGHLEDKRTKTNIKYQDQETKPLNKPISPRRLREGVAAILQALNKNNHTDILGIKIIKLLLTKRLCLPKRS